MYNELINFISKKLFYFYKILKIIFKYIYKITKLKGSIKILISNIFLIFFNINKMNKKHTSNHFYITFFLIIFLKVIDDFNHR